MRKFLVMFSALALLISLPGVTSAKIALLDDSVITGSNSNEIEVEVEHGAENEIEVEHGNVLMNTNSEVEIVAGTNMALESAVDSVMKKMEGVSAGDFCSKISGAVASLSPAEKASLAWRADSYISNLKLDASADATAEEKAEYELLKNSYEKISEALTEDGNITSSDRAAIRGSLMVLMNQYREGNVEASYDAKIRAFLEKSADCLASGTEVKSVLGTSTEVKVVAPIMITQKDISDDDMKAEVPATETVKSEETLKSFIAINLAKDANIKSVSTDKTKTETVYKQKGKLFGFIPVKMNVHAVVNADGSASVRYPWYKFMSSAVGGKVTSETVLENLTLTSDTELSKTDQANALSATVKAFGGLEVK